MNTIPFEHQASPLLSDGRASLVRIAPFGWKRGDRHVCAFTGEHRRHGATAARVAPVTSAQRSIGLLAGMYFGAWYRGFGSRSASLPGLDCF
jgi:hypothetical protein